MEAVKKLVAEFFGYSPKELSIGGVIAAFGGGLVAMVGGFDEFVSFLLFVQAMDILTGVYCAKKRYNISSAKGIKGIDKKVGIWIMIAFAFQIDKTFGGTGLLRGAAIIWYTAMEGLSLVENLTAAGVPIFQPLKDYLIQLKEGSKKGPSKLTEIAPPAEKTEG